MRESTINKESQGNRTRNKDAAAEGPILGDESDGLGSRIEEVVGPEAKRAFARRCGFSDGLLHAYIREQKTPGLNHFRSIAAAGGVTLDWLATGKGVKFRRDLVEQPGREQVLHQGQGAPVRQGAAKLRAVLPCREIFLDCTGRERAFEITQGPQTDGVVVRAREIDPPTFPGYAFSAWSATLGDAMGRLRERIRSGLSRRYLVEHPSHGLQLLASTMEGEIWSEGLVIDGRMVEYPDLRRLLAARDGDTVTIQIKDSAE